jgi:hypothetical protein
MDSEKMGDGFRIGWDFVMTGTKIEAVLLPN